MVSLSRSGVSFVRPILTPFFEVFLIWFTSKVITRPLYKLIESAEKVTEDKELKNFKFENTKRNTEIDELINVFETMTAGLKENLNKVTTQKKQIETFYASQQFAHSFNSSNQASETYPTDKISSSWLPKYEKKSSFSSALTKRFVSYYLSVRTK